MSRRKTGGHKITKSVTLNSERHAHILASVEYKENFSKLVQDALEAYLGLGPSVTLKMIYAQQGEILRKLDSGIVVGGQGDADEASDGDTLGLDILNGFG